MTQRSAARPRPTEDARPRIAIGTPKNKGLTDGGLTALLESGTQQILAVTYWFDPVPGPKPYAVTIRFAGRRVDVKGRLSPGDRFVHDETIEEVVPGSGPISLTARVNGINPGEWAVTARMLLPSSSARGPREQGNANKVTGHSRPGARLWRKWAPSAESVATVSTCLTPFARVPGILPGIWGAMVTLGIVVALVLQSVVIASVHLAVGPMLSIALVAIVVGIIGAKAWFIVLYRHAHRLDGWCIQGFITGATLAAVILLVVLKVPTGVFLDVTAPGLLLAMAVGRVGCFFAGCCGGPPTASRFGVWSSDQRVGARRIPTQLLESLLAGILGLLVLVAVMSHGPMGGTFFVAGLAAYTLGRQGLLRLRAEPRKTRLGGLATSALAVLVLIAAVVFLTR